jgi:hypothetical protein
MTAADEAVQAIRHGQKSFDRWAVQNRSKVTRELADTLAEEALRRQERDDLAGASVRFMTAAQIYWKVGVANLALTASENYLGLSFLLIDNPQLYLYLRDAIIENASEAQGRGLNGPAFRLTVLGADCAFQMAKGMPDPDQQAECLLLCLQDLDSAAYLVANLADPIALDRYSSLAAATFARCETTNWNEQGDRVEELLMRLAAATERFVPIEYSVAGNASRTADIARYLASLSNEYGNVQAASERRAFAARVSRRPEM